MTSRLLSLQLLTGHGPATRPCPECDGTGVLVSDNGPNPTELGCERCGGRGGQGPRTARDLRYGCGEVPALCEECGEACERGRAVLLHYAATRDEYCCSSYCALCRVYGWPVADELIEVVRLTVARTATTFVPVAIKRAG